MERVTKPIFIFLLLSISISASVFMIVESGSFFQSLYHSKTAFSHMGYWAAFLNEIFMAVMAAVWIPNLTYKNKNHIHPINYLLKFLLGFLFITTVCGSSLNTVYPLINDLRQHENQKDVIGILRSQIKDNEQSLDTFAKQHQKINSALTVRNQYKVKQELKEILQNQQSSFRLWIEIITIVLLRFGVQLSNLCCVWLAGWLYRRPLKLAETTETIQQQTQPQVVNLPKPNQPETHNLSSLGVIRQTRQSVPAKPAVSRQVPVKQGEKNGKKNGIVTNLESFNPLKKSESSIETLSHHEQENIMQLRKKIAKLLGSRNEGISLSEIGIAIGEKETSLKDIVNPRVSYANNATPTLENILSKIEKLCLEEQANSF